MNEREINKLIADIEKVTDPNYSPTTNWADCGPLITKYGITVDGFASKAWIGRKAIPSNNLLEAICLAVIYKDVEEYRHK